MESSLIIFFGFVVLIAIWAGAAYLYEFLIESKILDKLGLGIAVILEFAIEFAFVIGGVYLLLKFGGILGAMGIGLILLGLVNIYKLITKKPWK